MAIFSTVITAPMLRLWLPRLATTEPTEQGCVDSAKA
jgi:hypothetical protein